MIKAIKFTDCGIFFRPLIIAEFFFSLCLFGEPQWAVVGDTFPVGCRFSDKIVYPEYFDANPDIRDRRYNTKYGIYKPNCGLRNVHMSWGHDEYLYQMVKNYLPEPALYMIRYQAKK